MSKLFKIIFLYAINREKNGFRVYSSKKQDGLNHPIGFRVCCCTTCVLVQHILFLLFIFGFHIALIFFDIASTSSTMKKNFFFHSSRKTTGVLYIIKIWFFSTLYLFHLQWKKKSSFTQVEKQQGCLVQKDVVVGKHVRSYTSATCSRCPSMHVRSFF